MARPVSSPGELNRAAFWMLAWLSLCPPALPAESSHVLTNHKIKVGISGTGKLESVENLAAGETYSFREDSFALDTDLGLFSNREAQPVRVAAEKQRLSFHYEFGPEGTGRLGADLVYTLSGDDGFFRRALVVSNAAPLRLQNLVLGETRFSAPARETVHYLTFWMAPTVEFIRHGNGGLFTGIENPFYKAGPDEEGVVLSFVPGLILKAGEGYESEPQFMGVYKNSGVMIEDSDRPFRYPNGSGYYPVKVGWDFTAASPDPKMVAGAIEAEDLKIKSKSRGRVEPQDMSPFGDHWSRDRQLVWWGGLEPGDKLVLEIPIAESGLQALALHVSKAEDYGIFSFRLDDGPESDPMDFFSPRLQPPTIIGLKPAMLSRGTHCLTIRYHGRKPRTTNSLLGIDCIQIKDATK